MWAVSLASSARVVSSVLLGTKASVFGMGLSTFSRLDMEAVSLLQLFPLL
jgi:hypothetical protein